MATAYNTGSAAWTGSLTAPLANITTITASALYYSSGIHLVPNATNSPAIQKWINFNTSLASNPTLSWWATSRTPSYGNASVVTAQYCSGGVFVPPNGVLFVPANSTSILTFYPDNGTYTTAHAPVGTSGNFAGGLLLPTGNVLFCPQKSNVGMYNPLSSIYSNSTALPGGGYSGTLTANNVIFAPQGTPSNVINYNFTTGTISNVLALPSANIYGKSWFAETTDIILVDTSTTWVSVTWSPQLGLFVAVGNSGTAKNSAYSPDGKNWFAATTDIRLVDTATNWFLVTWSPQLGLFVAVGESGTAKNSAYSPDGKNWFAETTDIRTVDIETDWTSVTWSPQLGLFVAVGAGGTAKNSAYSPDGKNWFAATTDIRLVNTSTSWTSVTWSPQLGLFVAVGNSGPTNRSAYSPDGKNWFAATTDIRTVDTSTFWNSVTWSPQLGLFVAVGNGGTAKNSAYSSGTGLQQGACLLTNGNVIVPYPGTANVIQFNPVTLAASNLIVGTAGFNGLTLAPNGNVIGTPMNSNIIVINPSNFTSSNLNVPSSNANTQTFYGGACLSATGNIIFAPSLTITANVGTSNVGMYDPVAGSFSNSTPTGAGFTGATLMPSGKIIFTPGSGSVNAGVYGLMNPIDSTFCASPYFNKS